MGGDGGKLRDYLQRAELKPRELAQAINTRLERRGLDRHRIHPSTPYHWIRHGYCPHEPIPRIVVELLEERLGQRVPLNDLWPGRTSVGVTARHSDDELDADWTPENAVGLLDDLVSLGDVERRAFRPAVGVPLITAALDGITYTPSPVTAALGHERVLPPMMDLLAGHIAALRRLDDRQGGGALSLRYVTNELAGVLDLVRRSSYATDVGQRLYLSVANLAQLAGWMHFDAGEVGCAQRYFLLGLRAARSGGDEACAVNILGMLAYQSAHSQQPTEAVRMAEAAKHAARTLDPTTQARIAGRLATAYAASGDVYGFRAASDSAHELLQRRIPEREPDFLYYFSAEQLAAESGQALVDLAKHNPGRQHSLLAEATELLTPLTSAGLRENYQRSALLHGCYLTEAHLMRGDLESVAGAVRTALERLPGVQSGRCSAMLSNIRHTLKRRKRNKWVSDLIPALDRAF